MEAPMMGEPRTNVHGQTYGATAGERAAIIAALDLLFTGF
jgi:hypothetical protein